MTTSTTTTTTRGREKENSSHTHDRHHNLKTIAAHSLIIIDSHLYEDVMPTLFIIDDTRGTLLLRLTWSSRVRWIVGVYFFFVIGVLYGSTVVYELHYSTSERTVLVKYNRNKQQRRLLLQLLG
mmetsp:Transcript_50456/g.56368  ORF Transcript_50456/g.56368 Transcript_50456/m.56368 type:complete len:124 (-) Transcript_50456:262-633(-)